MPKYAQNSDKAVLAIRERRPFKTYGNLSATDYGAGAGLLSDAALEAFLADRASIDYVVYSYGTPIAWHTPDTGWTYVDRSFSPSTSTAQTVVRQALDIRLYSDDDYNGVRVLQRRYYVSPKQAMFLYSVRMGDIHTVRGGEIGTARALERKGLLTLSGRTVTLTDAGRDQI